MPFHISRYALTIGAASALLAGCGGSQPPIGAPGAISQSQAIATHPAHSGSWMLPETKSKDLIYAPGGCGGTCVLSYPDGKLVGTLDAVYGPPCSDSEGNVYLPQDAQVLEFPHAGTSPIATYTIPGSYGALACAADPMTGNLAVIFGDDGPSVAVFSNPTETPAVYSIGIYGRYCGYDNSGNLFVSGYYTHPAISELPYGASQMSVLPIKGNISGAPGQIQWDGSFMTYENGGNHNNHIARLRITDSSAQVVGRTALKGAINIAAQSWIVRNRVIVPYSTQGQEANKINIWAYPKSGKPVTKFGHFGGFTYFSGVTLSVAPSDSHIRK